MNDKLRYPGERDIHEYLNDPKLNEMVREHQSLPKIECPRSIDLWYAINARVRELLQEKFDSIKDYPDYLEAAFTGGLQPGDLGVVSWYGYYSWGWDRYDCVLRKINKGLKNRSWFNLSKNCDLETYVKVLRVKFFYRKEFYGCSRAAQEKLVQAETELLCSYLDLDELTYLLEDPYFREVESFEGIKWNEHFIVKTMNELFDLWEREDCDPC